MTVRQLLAWTTAEELAVWMALKQEEAKEQKKQAMFARAAAQLR